MGIDFAIELDCAPRRALRARLPELVKVRSRARTLRAIEGSSEAPVKVVTAGPSGSSQQVVTLSALEEAARPLEEVEVHCRGCPANLLDDTYGCFGAIGYPLSAQGETWLMERLPARIDVLPGQLLVKAVRDFELAGDAPRAMRDQGLLEARQPLIRRWSDEVAVSSDQVLELLFFCRKQGGPQRLMLYLFRAVDSPADPDELLEVLSGRKPLPPPRPDLAPASTDERGVLDLKRYVAALHRACALGVALGAEP